MELSTAALRALRDRLEAAFAPVDAELLGVGDRLGQAAARLRGLDEGFGELGLALGSMALDDAAARLDAAAQAMTGLAGRLGEERAALDDFTTRLRGVGLCIAALGRVNAALVVLARNSAIASSGIEAESVDIAGFQADVRRLTETAVEAVRRYERLHAEAVRDLAAVSAAQAEFARQQGPLLRDVAARIGAGLAAIAERRRGAAGAAGQVQQRGQAIGGAIATTVAALQVGDATRQRLEHVADALGQVAEGLDGVARPWCEDLAPPARRALAASALALQAAQLRDTGATFAAETRSIAGSLARLGEEARAMVALGTGLFGRGGRDGDSFLSALDRDLNAATRLLAEAVARRQAVEAAMAGIGGRMRSLLSGLEAIRDLEMDLRLAGLNAVLRCARLGEKGRALAAITLELRAFARQMAERVDALSAALEATLAAGATIAASDGATQAASLEDMMAGMRESLTALGGAGRGMDAAMGRLRADGGQVAEALGGMATLLAGATGFAGLIEAAADELEALRAGQAGAEAALLRDRLALVHAVPYTMAREREIARDFGADLPEAARAEVVELDDLLF